MTCMKRGRMRIACILLLAALVFWPGASYSETINWRTYEDGLAEAKAQNKNVFLYFNADWCRYCRLMEKETLSHKAVIDYLNRYFVSISVNSNQDLAVSKQYQIGGYPTSLFLDETLEPVTRLPGYVKFDSFYFFMEYTESDAHEKMTPREYYDYRFK